MKKNLYKVYAPKSAKLKDLDGYPIVSDDGFLAFRGKDIQAYTRGIAIKKARFFDGVIVKI